MMRTIAILAVVATVVNGLTIRNGTTSTANATLNGPLTFQAYYSSVKEGRGVWKWNNAIDCYERHFAKYRGKAAQGAEVGVQSGGSLDMWHAVLGEKAVIHGLDINPACIDFSDKSTISIGDQENPAMWASFFSEVTPKLDFLVDDGGHFPKQMLETTYAVWPKLNPGGMLAIEDIHGDWYLEPYFKPVAQFFGPKADVAAVHLYTYVILTEKTGGDVPAYDPTKLKGANIPPQNRISTFEQIDGAIAAAPAGSLVVLENPSWGRFINPDGLSHFFTKFIGLFQPVAMPDSPPGCAHTGDAVCTSGTTNSPEMANIFSVHILPDKLVIDVPKDKGHIVTEAVRHGTKWVQPCADCHEPPVLNKYLAGKAAAHFSKKR